MGQKLVKGYIKQILSDRTILGGFIEIMFRLSKDNIEVSEIYS